MRRATALAVALVWPALASATIQPPNEAAAEQVEQQCTVTGQELGFAGKRLAESVKSCVAEERPDLAVWETCRLRGREHGDSGAVLQGFVTDCLHGAP